MKLDLVNELVVQKEENREFVNSKLYLKILLRIQYKIEDNNEGKMRG